MGGWQDLGAAAPRSGIGVQRAAARPPPPETEPASLLRGCSPCASGGHHQTDKGRVPSTLPWGGAVSVRQWTCRRQVRHWTEEGGGEIAVRQAPRVEAGRSGGGVR